MHTKTQFFCTAAALFSLILTLGCGNPGPESKPKLTHEQPAPQAKEQDTWQISGRVATPGFGRGEVVAVGLDGGRNRFEIKEDSSFAMELAGDTSYAVYFFPPNLVKQPNVVTSSDFINTAKGPDLSKDGWAMLQFADSPEFGVRDTLRLPKTAKDYHLNFGEIEIKGSQAHPRNNPANSLDNDRDGMIDAVDPDDQNDGKNDREQKNDMEKVTICHYTGNKGTTQVIALSALFGHMSRGDTVGACKSGERPMDRGPNLPPANLPKLGTDNDPPKKFPEPLINPDVVIEETPDNQSEKVVPESKPKKERDKKGNKNHNDDNKDLKTDEEMDSHDEEEAHDEHDGHDHSGHSHKEDKKINH